MKTVLNFLSTENGTTLFFWLGGGIIRLFSRQFYYGAQAGLKLSIFQDKHPSSRITGIHHHAQIG
jgi:hypothetical protein